MNSDSKIPNSSTPPRQTPEQGGTCYDGPIRSGMQSPEAITLGVVLDSAVEGIGGPNLLRVRQDHKVICF
jgi:hypothetical protein